ncbi:MAG: hypothetical protein KatS3mg118_3129 [Paracoccaceae bacterium]|nr:MAG: hypothetical protein KatS3mg118_3129 [Paracoccaceae bacterium]
MLDVGARRARRCGRACCSSPSWARPYARQRVWASNGNPRVGLLNVGIEEHKGNSDRQEAHHRLNALAGAPDARFVYRGFVEGGDITGNSVDVIVTDGFTGNIALKTAEGTANLIGEFLSEAFRATPLARIAALFAYGSLRRLKKRIDPRRVNGGVFLGLNGAVVKPWQRRCHRRRRGAEAGLPHGQGGLRGKLAARVASGQPAQNGTLGHPAGLGKGA